MLLEESHLGVAKHHSIRALRGAWDPEARLKNEKNKERYRAVNIMECRG